MFGKLCWIEAGLAAITGLLAIVTPIWPEWIELITGWNPDHHNGSAEWMIIAGLWLATLALVFAAALEWRRTPAIGSL